MPRVTGVCLLLILLTGLPQVSAEGGRSYRPENVAKPTSEAFGFLKMTPSRSDRHSLGAQSDVSSVDADKKLEDNNVEDEDVDDDPRRASPRRGLPWATGRPPLGLDPRATLDLAISRTDHLSAGASPNSSVALMADAPISPSLPSVGNVEMRLRTCDSCLVFSDSFQCPMNAMAIELKKWITELHDVLSFGCHLGGFRGSRRCCHRRDLAFETVLTDMIHMARHMYTTFQSACSNCPRDGGWSGWCEWGDCSSTCGPGTRQRTRQCNNPTPKSGGRQCLGLATETIPCMSPDCCKPSAWSQWSPWSACDVTCGDGVRSRDRQCERGSCGDTSVCSGPGQETELCAGLPACGGKLSPAPRDGGWGMWSTWGACSSSCGTGMRKRTRLCDSPTPIGDGQQCDESKATETTSCHSGIGCMCHSDQWGPWEGWSSCDVTCGEGTRTRVRKCVERSCMFGCFGPKEDPQQCKGLPPCVPEWGPWSSCSASCRGVGGFRERKRMTSNDFESLMYGGETDRRPCEDDDVPPCP